MTKGELVEKKNKEELPSSFPTGIINKRDEILKEEIDAETLLFDPDSGKVFVLNPMAVVIWELCDGENTPAEISREISDVLDVDSEHVLNDVLNTVETFLNNKLVEVNQI